jgi:AAA domain-containing protein
MAQSLECNATAIGGPTSAAGLPGGGDARNGVGAEGLHGCGSLWMEYCRGVHPPDPAGWLQLAGPAGVLYTHRLPKSSVDPKPQLLAEVFAGKTDSLPSISIAERRQLCFHDQELDESQRDAVERALASPDIFLLEGHPGTGKSRVVAEVITQSARRGLTVLVLAPSGAVVDRILTDVSGREGLLSIRCLGGRERAEDLSPETRSLTLDAQADRLESQSLAHASAQCQHAEEQVAQCARDLKPLVHLRHCADQWLALDVQRTELLARRQQIVEDVAREAAAGAPTTPLGADLLAENTRHAQTIEQLKSNRTAAAKSSAATREEHERWQKRLQHQHDLLAARRSRRFLSLRFWQALFQGRAEQRLAEFQAREAESRLAEDKAKSCLQDVQVQLDLENQRHHTALSQITQQETSRRQTDVDHRLAEVAARQRELEPRWTEQRRLTARAGQLPLTPDVAAVQQAILEVERERQLAERHLQFFTSWQETLRGLAPQFRERLRDSANVIAVCAGDIATDPNFGDAGNRKQFDLLIIDQAERLSEAELLAHARRADRCLLVGQTPLTESWTVCQETGPRQRAVTPFRRLWQTLHCDPRRLPYQWLEETAHITCRLLPPESKGQGRIETERLVDHPDVELRILSRPNQPPVLTEVVFPAPKFTVSAAKAYLYQHLGELTLRPGAAGLRWRNGSQLLLLDTMGPGQVQAGECGVELEEGVREMIHRASASSSGNGRPASQWSTSRIEFDTTRGWDRPRAEHWLRERAGLRDLQRTALLETQWRMSRELTTALHDLLGEASLPNHERTSAALELDELRETVQFVAVPYPRDKHRSRPRGVQRPAPPPVKSFEIELSEARQRQRLPLDLQLKLPQRGIVNFAEAQAIVHLLDTLVRAPKSPTQARWSVAVLSWQAPQVQFLELLWASAAHEQAGLTVCFDTAANFRGREADIVLFSLCRSNAQRALGYADYPEEWRWALTAARRQLALFGDLDMLIRRSHNQGPVSRQSDGAAAMERAIASAFVKHFDSSMRRAAPQGVRT